MTRPEQSARPGAQLTALLDAFGVTPRAYPLTEPTVVATKSHETLAAIGRAAGLTQEQMEALDAAAGAGGGAKRSTVRPTFAPGPATFAGIDLIQPDQRSCVPTCLAVLMLTTNPVFAAWIATGRGEPSFASGRGALAERARESGSQRWSAAVAHLARAATKRGPVRVWPHAWGVAPWDAARVASTPGRRYCSRMVNDLDASARERAGRAIERAVSRSKPVIAYAGGDSRDGYGSAVPRHAVLLAPASDPFRGPLVFEPAAGRIFATTWDALAGPTLARELFGGWSHLTWLVLPRT
ncbi:hypothetical protein [Rarobacter incanus]|uniref:Uncharacterized protein n=1 Tax=Rarobacter incanus TaxID=153494 RepID=A0A542SN91_9MICO|nr:hypothetical protein [Rarobacter incanus]TQK76090.1 hypothetical protein FB389_0748 [Rarobacter incanus]